MKYILWLSIFLSTFLMATSTDYLKAIELYDQKKYEEAFPIILKEAQLDNYGAQYRVAEMYEHGFGVSQDYEEAIYWYKRSSFEHAYIDDSILKFGNKEEFEDSMRGNELTYSKLDTNTPETRRIVKSLTEGGFFGLQAYNTNYFLPISYLKDEPLNVPTRYHLSDPNSPIPASETVYDDQIEAEFQFSLKKQISYNFFGMNELIFFAYTQKVMWQLYAYSAPFRETNYIPELYMTVPSSFEVDNETGLKGMKYGFIHESNGQDGYQSRAWNRVYATSLWQWNNLFLAARAWYRIPEEDKPEGYHTGELGPEYADAKGDENPNIEKYLGYGDIKIDYLNGRSQYSLLLRNNLREDNKGAIEISYSYPIRDSKNMFLYMKFFNGYGDSLIDYNEHVTKAAIGFSFSRSLF